MLDYADILITPVSNPDGYEYTWNTVSPGSKLYEAHILISTLVLSLGSSLAQEPQPGNKLVYQTPSAELEDYFYFLLL